MISALPLSIGPCPGVVPASSWSQMSSLSSPFVPNSTCQLCSRSCFSVLFLPPGLPSIYRSYLQTHYMLDVRWPSVVHFTKGTVALKMGQQIVSIRSSLKANWKHLCRWVLQALHLWHYFAQGHFPPQFLPPPPLVPCLQTLYVAFHSHSQTTNIMNIQEKEVFWEESLTGLILFLIRV